MNDFTRYQLAYQNFFGKYNSVPGDMSNASSYFPNCATNPAWCNGDGNGVIAYLESIMSWRQLYLSGMISVFIAQTTSATDVKIINVNVPSGKIAGSGYILSGYDINGRVMVPNVTSLWNGTGKNSIYVGRSATPLGDFSGMLSHGAMNPTDAFFFDQKLDDGVINSGVFVGANTGVVRVMDSANITAGITNCIVTATPSTYNIQSSSANSFEGCLVGYQLN